MSAQPGERAWASPKTDPERPTLPTKKLIAYYRVSTLEQGKSGLGLEGQVAAVERYARALAATLLRSYQDVESGKRADRPALARALADCRRSRATLVIAKFDRLARNVHFLAGLLRSGVEFVACDNPHANKLTVHILAAVAEDEAERISERTQAALAAYKARGGLLGASRPECRNLTVDAQRKGAARAGQAARASAQAAYADLAPWLRELREQGLSFPQIAARLNAEGHTTRRGRPWNHVQVLRVLRGVTA